MKLKELLRLGHLVVCAPLLYLSLTTIFLAHPALQAEEKAERPIVKFVGIKEGGGGEHCQTLQRELSKTCELLFLPSDRGGDRISFRGGNGSLYFISPNKIKSGSATYEEIKRLLNLPFREKVDGVEEEISKH